jgi:hypothetical protein
MVEMAHFANKQDRGEVENARKAILIKKSDSSSGKKIISRPH